MKTYFQNLYDNLLIFFASHYLLFGYLFLTILFVSGFALSMKLLTMLRHAGKKHYFN